MEERKKWFHGMIHFYYFHGLMGLDHSQKKYFQGGYLRKNGPTIGRLIFF